MEVSLETDLLKTQITNELQKLDLKTNNLNENDSVLMDSLIEQSLSHGYTELLIRLIIHKCTYLSDIGDFDKAFSLINDALQLSKKYNSSNLMGDSTLKSGVLYFRQGNFEKALLNFFESLELFKSTDNTEKIGIVTRNIGVVYQRSGDYLKSFQYLQKALKLAKEHQFKELQASTLSWLGILESCYENYEAAINYYIESTALFEELKDIYNIAVNLNSIGLAYTIYNAELAHGYLKQAEDIARKDNNNFVLADVLHNYGLTFSEQKEYDKALEKYFESIEYRKKAMSKDKLSHTYTNIGNIYCIQGKYDLGLEYLNKGLKIREEANYQIRMVDSYYDIAFCYLDSKQYDNAIEMCNKALELAVQFNESRQLSNIYEVYYLYHKELGNLTKAYEFYTLYYDEKAKTKAEKTYETLILMQKKYEIASIERAANISRQNETNKGSLAMALTANNEINQPLMILQGNLDLLQTKLEGNNNESYQPIVDKTQVLINDINKVLDDYKSYVEDL